MPQKFYVTTPIYYVNARPHIGHAYTTIVADVLARHYRAQGEQVWFLTGTDEHGQKIERSASAAGVPPQAFTDEVSAAFQTLWARMGITNDQYIRTTSPEHQRGVQQLFRTLYERGQIYLSSYTGQYSIGEEMFVEGPPGTIGPDGRPTETVTEENFFFRLSDYQLPLLNLIESDELKITPESRKNEVLSFLRGNTTPDTNPGAPGPGSPAIEPDRWGGGLASETWVSDPAQISSAPFISEPHPEMSGSTSASKLPQTAAGTPYVPGALKDLSISRSSFTWGIPVPQDIQQQAGAKENHIIYVWLDALANYITALGYGDDSPEAQEKFAKFWPADLHLVGKEIIRFHCVYWPAFLLAANLPLPKAVTAHGWLLFEDSKMSKSKGNIVRTETILEAFGQLCPPNPATIPGAPGLASETWVPTSPNPTPHHRDLFAADVLRFFLLREIPFGQDGSFSFDALVTRYNADLANGLGNLVSRTLKMIDTYFGGVIPQLSEFVLEHGVQEAISDDLDTAITTHLERREFSLYLDRLAEAVASTDRMLSLHRPWKERETEAATLLNRQFYLLIAAAAIQRITILAYPVLPFTSARIWTQLGLGSIEAEAARRQFIDFQWAEGLPGTRLGPLGPIFPRADKKLAEQMTQMEQEKNSPMTANAAHDNTSTENTEFKETAIASESETRRPLSKLVDEASGHTNIANPTSFDPAAGPRTTSLPEPNPGQQVAGSNASTTERPGTPPHTEANPSGIFSGAPSIPESHPGMGGSTPTSGPADQSPQITIDDFAKIELRVAQIVACERIPKADKLLRLEVDLGYEKRQILSGIAEWYTPEDLIGRRIVVITNLAPRKMRGLESHGMLLAASSEGGKPALATFLDSDALPLGSRLK